MSKAVERYKYGSHNDYLKNFLSHETNRLAESID